MFLSDVCQGRVRPPADVDGAGPKELLEQHNRWCNELSADERRGLAARGVLETARLQDRLMDDAGELLGGIHEMETAMKTAQELHLNTVAGCRNPTHSRHRLLELLDTLQTHATDTQFRFGRDAASEVPAEPCQRAIVNQISHLPAVDFPPVFRPWWIRMMTDLRDHVRRTAMWWQSGGDLEPQPSFVVLPMHLQMNTSEALFLRAKAVDQAEDVDGVGQSLSLAQGAGHYRWAWVIEQGNLWSTVRDIGEADDCTLWIIPRVVLAGRYIVSQAQPVWLEEFTAGMDVARETRQREPRDREIVVPGWKKLLLDEFPWFAEQDLKTASKHHQRRRPAESGDDSGEGDSSPSEPDEPAALGTPEDLAADAVTKLTDFRDEWKWMDGELFEHFYVHDRSYMDCVAVYPRAHAKSWCEYVHAGLMHSFHYTAHGEYNAHLLARCWCMKLNYYFQAWMDNDSEDAEDIRHYAAFMLPDDYWDALHEVDACSLAFEQFRRLADWVPTF